MKNHDVFLSIIILMACALSGCASTATIKDFTTDGCSLFPDGTISERDMWCDCCFYHDIAYWRGGTKEERKQADKALRICIKNKSDSSSIAWIMYMGVRFGGHPIFPTWFRWAYGWSYGRGYEPLEDEGQMDAQEKLEKYFNENQQICCEEQLLSDQ